MNVYLVGGAVRDKLLGMPVKERDYVVVGSTEKEMLEQGYRSVGNFFPVFLHPQTNEEYALARTERKTGPGHQGFECDAGVHITLEQDLMRRDLTINAIAETDKGELLDPYHGQADLQAGILRHVSTAFAEDPLRVLRLARFKATFHHLGFSVHPETERLTREMIERGDLTELSPERILGELDKALTTLNPSEFFNYLDVTGAAKLLWPEIDPVGIRSIQESKVTSVEGRFAQLLLHRSVDDIDNLSKRLRCTNDRRILTTLINQHQSDWLLADRLAGDDILARLDSVDAFRQAARFQKLMDLVGELFDKAAAMQWQTYRDIAATVKAADIDNPATGPALGEQIRAEQVARIQQLIDRSSS